MKKIHMIEKLIGMLETNKNMRIREMFEERQRLSENQEEQKKLYQRKIEKVKEVEEKFKNRKIDEFTAIHELNGIHGWFVKCFKYWYLYFSILNNIN